jgi:hypothetical protein
VLPSLPVLCVLLVNHHLPSIVAAYRVIKVATIREQAIPNVRLVRQERLQVLLD